MPINENLSHYSDLAFGTAFAVYLLALTLLIAHFAATRPGTLRAADQKNLLVGAGGPPTETPGQPGWVVEAPRQSVHERLGRMGVSLIILFLLRIRYADGAERGGAMRQLARRLPDAQVLDQHRWVRRDARHPVHHQHRGVRTALLRRTQLTAPPKGPP